MNPQKNTEKMIRELVLPPTKASDERILNDALAAYDNSETKKPAHEPNIWRIIMKNPMTKLATAAAVILIAALGLIFFEKSATPAWAIDETIDLLREFNGMHVTGTMLNEEGKAVSFEAWARANEDQTASNHLRLETETGEIDVVSGHRRYQYDPATTNTIQQLRLSRSQKVMARRWVYGLELISSNH
jgi:hypothetical protein